MKPSHVQSSLKWDGLSAYTHAHITCLNLGHLHVIHRHAIVACAVLTSTCCMVCPIHMHAQTHTRIHTHAHTHKWPACMSCNHRAESVAFVVLATRGEDSLPYAYAHSICLHVMRPYALQRPTEALHVQSLLDSLPYTCTHSISLHAMRPHAFQRPKSVASEVLSVICCMVCHLHAHAHILE